MFSFKDPILIHSLFSIQQLAINAQDMSYMHRCNLHIIAVSLLSLVCRVTGVKHLMEYCAKIIFDRNEEAKYLIPPLLEMDQNHEKRSLTLPHLMLDKVSVLITDFSC